MILKVSKDYYFKQLCYEIDCYDYRRNTDKTYGSDYSATWEDVEISSFEELQELVNKQYAIRINC